MPRARPDIARLDITRDIFSDTSTEFRRSRSGIRERVQEIREAAVRPMLWAEARQTSLTNSDWWWLLRPVNANSPLGGPILLRMPDGSIVGRNPRQPNRVVVEAAATGEPEIPNFLPPPVSSGAFPAFTFGIEIEGVMPANMTRPELARKLTDAGVEAFATGWNHVTPVAGRWKLTTDGSIRCHGGRYERGVEFVSPILKGEEGIRTIHKVCEVLNAEDLHVNSSCGLHVHIGAENRPIDWLKRIIHIYAENELVIDSMLAPSRRASRPDYCAPCRVSPEVLDATNTAALRHAYNQTIRYLRTPRFRKVNLESLIRHQATGGTIEFRHHQGTVNGKKIEHWVRFIMQVAERAKSDYQSPATLPTLEEFLDMVGVQETTKRYLIARRNKFNVVRCGSLATAA